MYAPRPTPWIRTILTDVTGHIYNHQENTICADFELRLADCLEAYGYPKSDYKCKDFMDDMYECIYNAKQVQRSILMRNEREQQYKAGERKEQFEKPPRLDSY